MRLTYRLFLLVTALLLAVGILPAHDPVDDLHPVTVDVAVTDKDGNPIIGLERHHFKLFEDNVEQTITRLSTTNKQAAVVLIVEFSDTFNYYDGEVIPLATGFVNSFRPDDWIALVSFDVRPDIMTDFTRDKNTLFASLRRLWMPFSREASVYDAVYLVLERLEEVEGRKAIVLLTTGADTISEHNYAGTLKKAEASGTTIYAVGMSQLAKPVVDPYMYSREQIVFQADNVMRSLAEKTGGLSFFPRFSGEYRQIYETVNADLRHRYTLEFASTNQASGGKLRTLKVQVLDTDVNHDGKPDKLKARHKTGYYLESQP